MLEKLLNSIARIVYQNGEWITSDVLVVITHETRGWLKVYDCAGYYPRHEGYVDVDSFEPYDWNGEELE